MEPRPRRTLRRAVLGSACVALSVLACSSDFDTTRRAPPPSTLGDDMYSALCDRLGASVLTEDLEGASYRGICHIDASGKYADKVDTKPLGTLQGEAALTRQFAISKLEAMARRRSQLIDAFNATFPDDEISDPWDKNNGTVRGHVALSRFMKGIVPLYESNPVEPQGMEDTLPSVTRSTGRLFAGLAGPPKDDEFTSGMDPAQAEALAKAAQDSLAGLSGRQGYRPLRVTLGALRPALAYPELRSLAQTLTPHFEPNGDMYDALQDVLGMTQDELSTSTPTPLPEPLRVLDANTLQLNRPRTKLEVAAAMMLSQDPVFAGQGSEPRYLVQRDQRGVAIPSAAVMGSLIVDSDGDGLADVDSAGRFVGPNGLAQVDPPFVVPAFQRVQAPDFYGRALTSGGEEVYEYIDTSQTLTAALVRDLEPLLNPDASAPGGETVLNLLSGAYLLYGSPKEVTSDWAHGGSYPSFDTANSPLLDLIHAVGQVFAHPESDSWLLMAKQLMQTNEGDLARLIGAALRAREIGNQFPNVKLDIKSTFWDELMPVVVKLLRNEGLFRRVMATFKNPKVQNELMEALSKFNTYADRATYDPTNLNSPTLQNLSTGDTKEPVQVPVDYSKPDVIGNQSQWFQALQLIHDMNHVNSCNKQGAKVKVKMFGINLSWPLIGSYDECELLRIHDMGLLYLDALIDHYGEPRTPEGIMEIEDGLLNGILNLSSNIVSIDQVFEDSSKISGMSLNPTPAAFNRLVFFGTTSDKFDPAFGGAMLDRDPFIGKGGDADDTNSFVTGLIEPLSTSVCPTRFNSAHNIELADCSLSNSNDLLRLRDRGAIFTWEKHNFYAGIAPVVQAFDDPEENGQLFLELIEVLYRHWPSAGHGPECSKTGTWEPGVANYNPKYCSESGLRYYEPILAQIFKTDLIPALGRMTEVLEGTTINDARNGRQVDGVEMIRQIGLALLDPTYSQSVNMKDRKGKSMTTWSDGTHSNTPITPYELFAKAMQNFDSALAGSSRLPGWRSARSNLVDTFLQVDGSGAGAKFHNPSTPKATPILVDVLREQINANCPNRETSGTPCEWATTTMTQKAGETFEGPSFSTVIALLDLLNQDPETRVSVSNLLRYLLQKASDHDALNSTLTSLNDLMQLLGDDQHMPPIYNAVALAAAPEAETAPKDPKPGETPKPRPGAADRVIKLTQALTQEPADGTGNPYDRYRMLDRILLNLVSPIDPESDTSPTPLEVFLDTVAEVNRIDASKDPDEPLSPEDFQAVFATVRDFLLSKNRGMEQFYEIVRGRNGN
ncbi:MAG: hypothetical protein R3B07_06695 [Polyangiaceae bacterium]